MIDIVKLANGDSDELQKIYLQYVNDFLTYKGVSVYYGWTVESATRWIEQGKEIHESRVNALRKGFI